MPHFLQILKGGGNPYHEPAGSPKGGQFAHRPGATESLSLEEAKVEAALYKKLANYKASVAEYNARPDSFGGKVLSTDIVRELSPDYMRNRTLSAAVHEPSSVFIKRVYADRLRNLPSDGQVMFTSGGTGAGKTSVVSGVKETQAVLNNSHIVYDTNMNRLESAQKKIEQALAANAKVHIVHVQRDPVDSLVNGSLTRSSRQEVELGSGRVVPLVEHAKTHIGAAKVIQQLSEIYKDNPNVVISVIDNTRGKGNQRVVTIDFIKNWNYDGVEEKLRAALRTEYDAGRISEAIFRATAGTTFQSDSRDAGTGNSATNEKKSEFSSGRSPPGRLTGWDSAYSLSILKANPYHDERGRFTTADGAVNGAAPKGTGFVSPNIDEGVTFDQAIGRVNSERTKRLVAASREVDQYFGVQTESSVGIGAWSDGAEQSLVDHYVTGDAAAIKASMALKGLLGNQKSVIAFANNKAGSDTMYRFVVDRKPLREVHETLLKEGVEFHTLVQKRGGVEVFVFSQGTEEATTNAVQKASERLGATGQRFWKGQGETVGSWTSREVGRKKYEEILDAYESQRSGAGVGGRDTRWRGLRDKWLPKIEEVRKTDSLLHIIADALKGKEVPSKDFFFD